MHDSSILQLEEGVLFHEGQKVKALYPPNGQWYKATVIKTLDASVEVEYINDRIRRSLKLHQIKVGVLFNRLTNLFHFERQL